MRNTKKLRLLSTPEFVDIIRKHKLYQAGRTGGACAQLSRCDLTGLNLTDYELSYADLTGAALCQVIAPRINLSGSILFGADLSDGSFINANLSRSDLRGACLKGATLIGANIEGADLREGILSVITDDELVSLQGDASKSVGRGANFSGANLSNSKISGAIANNTNFSDAILRNCKMKKCVFEDADFTGAILEGADLSKSKLAGALFNDAIIVGTKFDLSVQKKAFANGALGSNTWSQQQSLRDAGLKIDDLLKTHKIWCESLGRYGKQLDLSNYNLRGVKIADGTQLSLLRANNTCFYQASFSSAQIQASEMQDCDMRFLNAIGTDFRGFDAKRSNLNHANLDGADFGVFVTTEGKKKFSDLTDCRFRYARLTKASFKDANLANVDFSYAFLRGVNFEGANLQGAIFKGAEMDPDFDLVDISQI